MTKRMRCEVWRYKGGLIVFTDDGDGGGTRVVGPKTLPSERKFVGEFHLDEAAIDALREDLDSIPEAR